MEDSMGVYVMQVASMLTGMHPQTMRKYERAGFLVPSRHYKTRMYSDDDIARLKMIKHLVDNEGLNIAGVGLALKMWDRLLDMREEVNSSETERRIKKRFCDLIDEMLDIVAGQYENP
jgi:MerR family transcriptional regulator/heat shock protein HspR